MTSEQNYLNLLREVLHKGKPKSDRTGVGTLSLFGKQVRFDLNDGFPLMTTKKVPFGLIKSELLWFLKGDTNIQYLLKRKNHIWTEWAFKNYVNSKDYNGPDMTDFGIRANNDPEFKKVYLENLKKFEKRIVEDDDFANKYGDLGRVYGAQWRDWKDSKGNSVDQIKQLIEDIKTNPHSRRLIVSAWNPGELKQQALPPCHSFFQFYVNEGKLSCMLTQRSSDLFLGEPFNIASYSLLIHLIARECDLQVGEFVQSIGDAHIYSNHIEQVQRQLNNEQLELPELWLNPEVKSIFDFDVDDIKVINYKSAGTIKAPVAV